MLYSDPPARIHSPGTFPFTSELSAAYTIGADFVYEAVGALLSETTEIASDIEGFGLGIAARRLKAVQFGHGNRAVVLDPRDPNQARLVQRTHEHATKIIFHNSAFDVPNLYMNGLIRLEDVLKVEDTLLWARLANPDEISPKGLEAASERYLKTGPGGELQRSFKMMGLSKKAGFWMYDLDRPIYVQGAASDPLLTHRLRPIVRQAAYDRLTKGHPFNSVGVKGSEAWDLVDREQIINRWLLVRACIGFRVDFEYLDQYTAVNAQELRETEEALRDMNIRPGVGQDLARALEAIGAIPPNFPRTVKTNQIQMTKKTMPLLTHPIARKFMEHKEIEHIRKDYIQKTADLADENGRVHPTVNLLAATTGRASIGDPPVHQYSGPARPIIMSDDGDQLTSIDWSQIEPITMANVAGDKEVIRQYEAGTSDVYTALGVGSGMLPHGTTSADCDIDVNRMFYGVRKNLKIVLLAQLFGEGMEKLTADLGMDPGPYVPAGEWEARRFDVPIGTPVPTFREAKKLKYAVFSAMPETEQLIQKLKRVGGEHRLITTISGRILGVPMSSYKGRWSVATHKAVNYFCQGSAYDILADSLLRIIKADLGSALYLTMHDELIVSTSASRDIRKIMETPPERLCLWAKRTPILRTDMKDLGESWAAA